MKFSNETLSILKNFSAINSGMVFKPGNQLRTIHPQKTIMAVASIGETIESKAGVFDLSRFLATLSLFDDPDVEFTADRFVIKSGKSKVTYTYAAESTIVSPPEKEITFPKPEATVNLLWKELDSVIKAASILKLGEIAFVGDGDKVTLSAVDSKNPTADTYSIVIADGGDFGDFKMLMKVENLKLMPNDYEVALSSRGLAQFKSNKVNYWIALEAK